MPRSKGVYILVQTGYCHHESSQPSLVVGLRFQPEHVFCTNVMPFRAYSQETVSSVLNRHDMCMSVVSWTRFALESAAAHTSMTMFARYVRCL